MNWIKAFKVFHTVTGTQCHYYHYYYYSIIIIKIRRRIKLATQLSMKCWVLLFLSYRQFYVLFKNIYTFFFPQ